MAKWVHPDVLDGGLNIVRNNGKRMSLITAFSPGDSYAVVSGRSVCNVTMAPGDFPLSNYGTNERQILVATKSGTASADSGLTPNLHIAILDTANSKVLAVANETSDQPIKNGNPITFPQWSLRGRQPL